MMGRDIGGSSADGPARDHREGRAAEMVRSTVAKSVQTSANWPWPTRWVKGGPAIGKAEARRRLGKDRGRDVKPV